MHLQNTNNDGQEHVQWSTEFGSAEEPTKRKTLVGPWKNVAEFHQVYDWLFGKAASAATRRQALGQMRVWSLRRSALCPAAVLATSVLLEVQLKAPTTDKLNLQTLYACAFTRFFNFMSSIMQTHNQRTMYDTARQLGLQSFVVDLRHICAHGQQLPPLEVLSATAVYCVGWLHDYYWAAQRDCMSDVDASRIRRNDKTQFDADVTRLFGIYDAALEGFVKGASTVKTAKRHLHGKRYTQLKQFCDGDDNDDEPKKTQELRPALDALVKRLQALVRREMAIKDLPEIYTEAFLKMRFFFTLAESHGSGAPLESLIDATQSLFRMLADCGFIDDVFHALLAIAEDPVADAARRTGASFWATQIANGFVAFRKCKQLHKSKLDESPYEKDIDFSILNSETISKRLRHLLIYAGVDVKRTFIFGDSLRRPWIWVFERSFVEERLEAVNEYTAPVLKSLLPLIEPVLAPKDIKAFAALIDTRFELPAVAAAATQEAQATEIGGSAATLVYTASDLLKQLQESAAMQVDADVDVDVDLEDHPEGESEYATAKEAQFGIWSMVTDDETHSWASCPLGRLPWE